MGLQAGNGVPNNKLTNEQISSHDDIIKEADAFNEESAYISPNDKQKIPETNDIGL